MRLQCVLPNELIQSRYGEVQRTGPDSPAYTAKVGAIITTRGEAARLGVILNSSLSMSIS